MRGDDGRVYVDRPASELAVAKRWLLETFLSRNGAGIRRLALHGSTATAEYETRILEEGRHETDTEIVLVDFDNFVPATITYFGPGGRAMKWAGVARQWRNTWDIILVPRRVSEEERASLAGYDVPPIVAASASGVEKLIYVHLDGRADQMRLTPTRLGVPGLHIGFAGDAEVATAVFRETFDGTYKVKPVLWSEEKQMTILMPSDAESHNVDPDDDTVGGYIVDTRTWTLFDDVDVTPIVDAAVEICESKRPATRIRKW